MLLKLGFLCTWIAGLGRYWDHPNAYWWQYLGLGSLMYVLLLAAIIFVLLLPFKPNGWTYKNVLLFVTLTSPPAILYAIPVEKFLSMDTSATINVWFLAIVALWRVALYVYFLKSMARLSGAVIIVASLLPITLIIVTLSLLNLEHATFEIMAGINPSQKTSADGAYLTVLILSFGSALLFPVLLIAYLCIAVKKVGERG
ncbi:hypothetical protein [Glaciecola sp. MF2-115]|uniref:hypothetical protein n=1 Tax=Glaciecola sp. MF2-115 TaxID=3384827 RepID=UPI0039A032F3